MGRMTDYVGKSCFTKSRNTCNFENYSMRVQMIVKFETAEILVVQLFK